MIRIVARKLVDTVVTLFAASIIIFVGVRALPGDPAQTLAGENQDPLVIAAARAKLGLDDPSWVQYLRFLRNAVTGDFGNSLHRDVPVSEQIAATLPVTIQLACLAMVIAALFGIGFGIVAAYWRGKWPEGVANGVALFGLSVPNFWMGLIGIMVLAVTWKVLPASGYVSPFESPSAWFTHLIMPAFVLAVQLMAVLLRQTRSSLIESLEADYVLAVRSHGIGEGSVVFRHGMRNSLIVLVTIMGMEFGTLLSGAVITERLFGIPGFGKLTVDAITQRDYAVVQATVLITVFLFIIVNLVVDLLYGLIDPRIRVGGRLS